MPRTSLLQDRYHHPHPEEIKDHCHSCDYRPVSLTSVVMKSIERLVPSHLKTITDHLNPLQIAYRANGSVDDAVNMALHFILQHLESAIGTYDRVLFVDFSSAFNTIILALLQDMLSLLHVPDSTCK